MTALPKNKKGRKDKFSFPFPYIPEKFTAKEKQILLNYFTNWDKPVFAIHNLPQEVVGAMFSRYSRSTKSVRRLFLDEFWAANLLAAKVSSSKEMEKARERTKNFFQRVFAEYGDDSVIQMGSVHIAFEYVSQLIGAKGVEDQRIGAAYIEKSTRYVNFGDKVDGQYLYMVPPEIIGTEFEERFRWLNNRLFEAYISFYPITVEFLESKYPLGKQIVEDTQSTKKVAFDNLKDKSIREQIESAYKRAVRAKAFDTIRYFLPLSTVTNLGAHFSGHATETTLNKMLASEYAEVRILGKMALDELVKVSPNFLQNVDHEFGEVARRYRVEVRELASKTRDEVGRQIEKGNDLSKVNLTWFDKDVDLKLSSQILYEASSGNTSKKEIVRWVKKIKRGDKKDDGGFSRKLVKIILNSLPDRKKHGRNRRQKPPRAFEHVFCDVEFFDNIGTYKDLQRNRMSTTQRQKYSAQYVDVPVEYKAKGMEEVLHKYIELTDEVRRLQEKMLESANEDVQVAAEYVGVLGNMVRFNVCANLRQWTFFSELRTIAGGHPSYRRAMQSAVSEIIKKAPFTKKLFAHVDWTKDYGLGRFKAETSTQKRLSDIKS